MEIKLYSSKGLDDLDIPEEYKGWVLDQTSSKTTDAGRLFITATYKRGEKDGPVDVHYNTSLDVVTDDLESSDVERDQTVEEQTPA